MKDIYVAFLASNYKIGKVIRTLTRAKYNHVALSETPNLKEMFSFARRYVNTPLVAGFVRELPSRYLYDGKRTQVKVCKLQLSDEAYDQMKAKISNFLTMQDQLRYNFLSIVTYPLHRPVRVRGAYMCVDFVCYALGMESFCTIGELERLLADRVVFEGDLRLLALDSQTTGDYFNRKSVPYQLRRYLEDMAYLIRNAFAARP